MSSESRERTLELLASREGLDREPLERLVNTHCHSDHMGGNAAVASAEVLRKLRRLREAEGRVISE